MIGFLSGCTAAGTNVTSLLGNLGLFKLEQTELRIQSSTELSNIQVRAQCTTLSTGFEIDISNPASDAWSSATVPYLTVNDQCASSGFVEFTLNLSSEAPFSTMALGDSYQVRFRDINAIGMSTTETLTIIYSNYNLASHKRVVGQGGNITLTSGTYSLKGRLLEVSDQASTSGSYTMKGKVVFQ